MTDDLSQYCQQECGFDAKQVAFLAEMRFGDLTNLWLHHRSKVMEIVAELASHAHFRMALPVEVPVGRSGNWQVEEFSLNKEDSDFTLFRAKFNNRMDEYVPAGTYKRLVCRGTVVMSNTPMEIRTNWDFIERASGDVLINGLGLGMTLTAILKKPSLRSVTVIEASQDVIELVGPTFATDPRVTIIHADAFTYESEHGRVFDMVWSDIWNDICSSNLPQMITLQEKYTPHAKWQGCWAQQECEDRAKISKAIRETRTRTKQNGQ
ncbi:spermidine synthase [compost metagenome]